MENMRELGAEEMEKVSGGSIEDRSYASKGIEIRCGKCHNDKLFKVIETDPFYTKYRCVNCGQEFTVYRD